MNASPHDDSQIPDTLSKYFTLDEHLNPVGVGFYRNIECICAKHLCKFLQGSFYGHFNDVGDDDEIDVDDMIMI